MSSVTDQLGGSSTALLLSAPMDPGGEAACFDLLAGDERPPRNVLNVVFTRRPRRRVEDWKRHVGRLPESFVVLSSQAATETHDGAVFEQIGPPGDLTGIGVAITNCLSEWSPHEPCAFCLHSATAQLQYADRERVYQFLHTLCGHLTSHGAVGHVHLNPTVHDDQTVETFKTLFDAVVEVEGEEASVATR